MFHHLFDHARHDLHVRQQKVVARHARLACDPRGDHDDIRAGGLLVAVAPQDAGVRPDDRSRFEHIEGLALRQPLDDVDEHHVRVPFVEYPLRGRRPDVPRAHNRHLASHTLPLTWLVPHAQIHGRTTPAPPSQFSPETGGT